MLNIVIFGAPGSGKGTQSEMIAERYGLKHLSTGEILREEIASSTELGKLADSYMSKGELVPDCVVIEMLEELLAKQRDRNGFIFDGFPRTVPQGEALNQLLQRHGKRVNAVVSLEVEDEELIERLLRRGVISGRADDNRQTIESRLKVYYRQTAPLKEFYREQGLLKEIKGVGSIDAIFGSIVKEIDSLSTS
ncbi:MAG: adenylate kinase [Proteiniphilum sp.]|jgi:adenylate kinase|nr:adenylate kinase [Proteiniphilum sp.]NCD13717.1 adenylate kinase [Bacteroidia bacterium]HHT34040.1 adenylate kinase [Bacteroidales bacterium]MDD2725794.1 adenylate kinase [Proteiniphilum sp.]MDD3331812.1 adenylate kinase [Proteiniphilum sp.]